MAVLKLTIMVATTTQLIMAKHQSMLHPHATPKHLIPKALQSPIIPTEPCSYTQVAKVKEWCGAMALEFEALQNQGTWSLGPLPKGKHAVGNKWQCRVKKKIEGTIERYNARLVAKALTNNQEWITQIPSGFCPVVKNVTIKKILTIAIQNGWHIHQLDVHNIFLPGILKRGGIHITTSTFCWS